ncbi:MAG: amino acid ABC transporter substrate-binding protein [Chitinophagales bacterium]|nr:amino acid ABC transporter substrate-binding protein [Chitinophagales bacterium]
MTSVLNRLLPLNGNSLFIIFASIFIYSCGASKKASDMEVERFYTKKNAEAKRIAEVKRDSIIAVKKSIEEKAAKEAMNKPLPNPFEELKPKSSQKKDKYQILVILPFNAGEIWKMDLSKTDNTFPEDPKQCLQYWEGMNLAIDKWKHRGLNIVIDLYDNKKQDSSTINILARHSKNLPDVIIAPFHTRQASIVADFALNHKIPCFLPYNPSDRISNNNPYLFKFNPSLVNIYKHIYHSRLAQEDSSNLKFHIIFKDNIKSELEIAKVFEKYTGGNIDSNQFTIDQNPKVFNFVVTNKKMLLSNHLLQSKKNIILIPSSDDKYINSIITSIKNTKAKVEVYGVPSWENSELLDLKNMASIKPIIYTDYYNTDTISAQLLDNTYRKDFGESLNADVIKGYDAMNFIAENLLNSGINFPHYIQKFTYFGIGSQYKFEPIYDKKKNIDNFENKAWFKLQLLDGEWKNIK